MRILAHRGYWNSSIGKNSSEAFRTSLAKGYGFESDIRDYTGRLVISHNIADDSSQDAEAVFQLLREFGDKFCFAINIKADGLKDFLKVYLERYDIKNYFLFDMSVPQMVEFKEMGLRYFTRQSEIEKEPCLYEDAAGVWVDGFWSTDWISEDMVAGHIAARKEVCLVSPDLHSREYMDFWQLVKDWQVDESKLFLCTDHPDEAKEVFS